MLKSFNGTVTAAGDGDSLPAAKGRYHLYVSLACPFAHRTLVLRKLKGLEEAISVDVVSWNKGEEGWHFDKKQDKECTEDSVGGHRLLRDIYHASDKDYAGKISVPVLFDKQEKKIVNNESGEIIVMFNSAFNEFSSNAKLDLYPEKERKKIDETIKWINDDINLGVYKTGFAGKQEDYDKAVKALFKALDRVEGILSESRYLLGDDLTLADVRLYTSLVRFDPVYFGLFKCNKREIRNYPNMQQYLKELYQMPAFGSTTNFDHIKQSYYVSMANLNPSKIVPVGPELDLESKHDRDKVGKK